MVLRSLVLAALSCVAIERVCLAARTRRTFIQAVVPEQSPGRYILAVLVDRKGAVITKLQPADSPSSQEWSIATKDRLPDCVDKQGTIYTDLPCRIRGTSNVPKNQKKGGQSAPRFQRARLNSRNAWTNHVAHVTVSVLQGLLSERPAGVIVVGNADVPGFVNKELLENTLPGHVPVYHGTMTIEAAATDSRAGHQVSKALAANTEVSTELKTMLVTQDPATEQLAQFDSLLEEGYAVPGACSVNKALEWSAVRVVLICLDQEEGLDQDLLAAAQAHSVEVFDIDPTASANHAKFCSTYKGIGALMNSWTVDAYTKQHTPKPWVEECMAR